MYPQRVIPGEKSDTMRIIFDEFNNSYGSVHNSNLMNVAVQHLVERLAWNNMLRLTANI